MASQLKAKINRGNDTANACDIEQVHSTALSCRSSGGIMDWLSQEYIEFYLHVYRNYFRWRAKSSDTYF